MYRTKTTNVNEFNRTIKLVFVTNNNSHILRNN